VTLVDWTGITDAEKDENRAWCEEFEKRAGLKDEASNDPKGRKPKECKGGCGEMNSKLMCSKCKETCERWNIISWS